MRPVDSIHPISHEEIGEALNWVWPNVIPRGCITVLDGDPGTAKSLLTVDWAARLSRGRAWPDESRFDGPGPSILFCGEESRYRTVHERLVANDADRERIFVLGTTDDPDSVPCLPADLPWLTDLVARVQPKLVVFDPVDVFFSTTDNRRRAVVGLSQLASRHDVAIVLVRHLVKRQYGKAMYRGAGALGIVGAARCCLLASVDPTDPSRFVLAATKFNVGRLPPTMAYRVKDHYGSPVLEWLGAVAVTAEDASRGRGLLADRPGEVHAAEWLVRQLEPGERPAAQLLAEAKSAGIRERTLHRAKSALRVQSRLNYDRGKRSWLWSLPRPHPDELPPPEAHELLAQFLEKRGMTAEGLVAKTGFSRATVDSLLSGELKPTEAHVRMLADAFGVKWEDVVGGG